MSGGALRRINNSGGRKRLQQYDRTPQYTTRRTALLYTRLRYVPEFLNPLLISDDQPIMKTKARMRILERAAHVNMAKITQRVVQKMELHAAKFVNAATRSEDMVYGEQKPIGAYFDAVHV